MDSEPWKGSLESLRPASVVMLAGGGAPTKDLLLLRNLLAQSYINDHVHYYLTDISMWMLRESALWISEYSQNIDKSKSFSLGLVHGDVLDASSAASSPCAIRRSRPTSHSTPPWRA